MHERDERLTFKCRLARVVDPVAGTAVSPRLPKKSDEQVTACCQRILRITRGQLIERAQRQRTTLATVSATATVRVVSTAVRVLAAARVHAGRNGRRRRGGGTMRCVRVFAHAHIIPQHGHCSYAKRAQTTRPRERRLTRQKRGGGGNHTSAAPRTPSHASDRHRHSRHRRELAATRRARRHGDRQANGHATITVSNSHTLRLPDRDTCKQ